MKPLSKVRKMRRTRSDAKRHKTPRLRVRADYTVRIIGGRRS